MQGASCLKRLLVALAAVLLVGTSLTVPASAESVSTGYKTDGVVDLIWAAEHFGYSGPGEMQKAGVSAIRFFLGVAGKTDKECDQGLADSLDTSGLYVYESEWSDEELEALEWVTSHYCITKEQAQEYGGTLFTFFAGLDAGKNGTTATRLEPPIADGLDPTFGNGGGVTVFPHDCWCSEDYLLAGPQVAVQLDGRVLVAGSRRGFNFETGNNLDIGLFRFEANGRPDIGFGDNGVVETDFGGSESVASLVVQEDGKILVGGSVGTSDSRDTFDFGVVRYNVDGSLDGSFGKGGLAKAEVPGEDYGGSTLLQDDGKIVVAGTVFGPPTWTARVAVVRFDSEGRLDSTFGSPGDDGSIAGMSSTGLVETWGFPLSAAVQDDGKIVVAVDVSGRTPFLPQSLVLLRFDPSGKLDVGFGADGIVMVEASVTESGGFATSIEDPRAVVIRDDGKILVGGRQTTVDGSGLSTSLPAAIQFNSGGEIDTTFGSQGMVVLAFSSGSIGSLLVGTDGLIRIAGPVQTPSHFPGDTRTLSGMGLARLGPDGTPDTTFGQDGLTSFWVQPVFEGTGGITMEQLRSMAIQPDGRPIFVASGGTVHDLGHWYLMRYVP